MAYNFDDEKRELVASVDKNDRGDSVYVTHIVNSKTSAEWVDIRWMYKDDKDETKPTKKGLRVSTELLPEIIKALMSVLSEEEVAELIDSIDEGTEEPED